MERVAEEITIEETNVSQIVKLEQSDPLSIEEIESSDPEKSNIKVFTLDINFFITKMNIYDSIA